jgi:beta-glucanase (GH16 family)
MQQVALNFCNCSTKKLYFKGKDEDSKKLPILPPDSFEKKDALKNFKEMKVPVHKLLGKNKYKLTFVDQFQGGKLNEKKWNLGHPYAPANEKPFNNELQKYDRSTAGNEHVVLDKRGFLRLKATKDPDGTIKSGAVNTKGKYNHTYGYWEIRAKIPAGNGTWPALWTHADPTKDKHGWMPEFDILESGGGNGTEKAFGFEHKKSYGTVTNNLITRKNPSQVWSPEYTVGYPYKDGSPKNKEIEPFHFSKDFHRYGMEWKPESVAFYLDGKKIRQINKHVETIPQIFIANVAVGGAYTGISNPDEVLKNGPAEMDIDYVAAWAPEKEPIKQKHNFHYKTKKPNL